MKTVILKLAILSIFAAAASAAEAPATGVAADEALARLMAGNQRFVSGAAEHPRADRARRAGLVSGQKPVAAVLAFSDSRVPPEIIFDQGLGDIFAVRVAGNLAGADERGSLDYAAERLGVPVIMVLGHTGCGAAKGGVTETAAAEENVRLNALALLRKDPVIKKLAAAGKLKVAAAIYDLSTGEVRLLDLGAELEAARRARITAMRGLVRKLREGALDDSERASLADGLGELVPGLE